MRLRAAALSRRAYEAATAGRWLWAGSQISILVIRAVSFYRIANAIELAIAFAGSRGWRVAVGRAVYTAIIIVESPSLWLLTVDCHATRMHS